MQLREEREWQNTSLSYEENLWWTDKEYREMSACYCIEFIHPKLQYIYV